MFREHHARNVSWVFSIDSLAGGPPTPLESDADTVGLKEYYPGKAYVDWIGLSGFNWGPESFYPTERSFLATFQPTVDVVSEFDKPVMLAEVGTSALSADPAGWLGSALEGRRRAAGRQVRRLVRRRHP